MYKQQEAFTLIEIITSLALLSMIIIGLLPMFPQIMSWSSQSENHLTASHLLPRVVSDVTQHASELSLESASSDGTVTLTGSELAMLPDYAYDVVLHITYEHEVDLYQTNIQLVNKNGSVISESYTYIKGADVP